MRILPSVLSRPARVALASTLVAGAALLGVVAAPPAQAAPGDCAPVEIYFNSSFPTGLYRYSPQYGTVSSLPLDEIFLDITFSPDGSRLYGLTGGGLAEIDQLTGETIESFPVPGLSGNALAQLPDGGLIAASGSSLIDVDLETRTATPDPRSLPEGYSSSGDLLVLPDSDLLVVASQSEFPGDDALVRITPEGVTTVLGTVPPSYGISASGDSIYLTATNGAIHRIDGLPTPDADSGEPIALTTVRESTGTSPYGATSINESKPCNTAYSATVSDESVPLGTPTTLIAYAYPAGTGGSVTFSTGDTELCTADISPAADAPDTRCESPADLPPGYHLVTATFSESGAVATTSFVVERVATAITVTATPPSVPYATSTALRVSGLPEAATGNLNFYYGESTFCTVTLPDTVCAVPTNLVPNPYAVYVVYSGDPTYQGAEAVGRFEVTRLPSELRAEAAQPSVLVGEPDEVSAAGLPDGASGTVTFTLAGEVLCTVDLPEPESTPPASEARLAPVSCPTPDDLAVGTYTVVATYSGDRIYEGSEAEATFTVTAAAGPADPDPSDPDPSDPADPDPADPDPSGPTSVDPSPSRTVPVGPVAVPTSTGTRTAPGSPMSGLASTGGTPLVVLAVGLVAALLGGGVLLGRRRRGLHR